MIWRKILYGLQVRLRGLPGGSTPPISDNHNFQEPCLRYVAYGPQNSREQSSTLDWISGEKSGISGGMKSGLEKNPVLLEKNPVKMEKKSVSILDSRCVAAYDDKYYDYIRVYTDYIRVYTMIYWYILIYTCQGKVYSCIYYSMQYTCSSQV